MLLSVRVSRRGGFPLGGEVVAGHRSLVHLVPVRGDAGAFLPAGDRENSSGEPYGEKETADGDSQDREIDRAWASTTIY